MISKIINTTSSIFLGVTGLLCSFLPQELLAHFDQPNSLISVLSIKILGATYISFAILNWLSKERLMGGVHNRPLALSNALHFSVVAITLVKLFISNQSIETTLGILTIIYSIFALAYLKTIFTTPKEVSST